MIVKWNPRELERERDGIETPRDDSEPLLEKGCRLNILEANTSLEGTTMRVIASLE